jgi:hypothetical protein
MGNAAVAPAPDGDDAPPAYEKDAVAESDTRLERAYWRMFGKRAPLGLLRSVCALGTAACVAVALLIVLLFAFSVPLSLEDRGDGNPWISWPAATTGAYAGVLVLQLFAGPFMTSSYAFVRVGHWFATVLGVLATGAYAGGMIFYFNGLPAPGWEAPHHLYFWIAAIGGGAVQVAVCGAGAFTNVYDKPFQVGGREDATSFEARRNAWRFLLVAFCPVFPCTCACVFLFVAFALSLDWRPTGFLFGFDEATGTLARYAVLVPFLTGLQIAAFFAVLANHRYVRRVGAVASLLLFVALTVFLVIANAVVVDPELCRKHPACNDFYPNYVPGTTDKVLRVQAFRYMIVAARCLWVVHLLVLVYGLTALFTGNAFCSWHPAHRFADLLAGYQIKNKYLSRSTASGAPAGAEGGAPRMLRTENTEDEFDPREMDLPVGSAPKRE